MIRKIQLQDIQAITDIYNFYVIHSTATFDLTPLSHAEMQTKLDTIAAHHPCFVFETDGEITGYCYAHPWKERAAYAQTWETTVYVAPGAERKGIGTRLMEKLIEACRPMICRSLIACITEDNHASRLLHERLGFTQVSHFKEVGFKFGKWLGVVDYQLFL